MINQFKQPINKKNHDIRHFLPGKLYLSQSMVFTGEGQNAPLSGSFIRMLLTGQLTKNLLQALFFFLHGEHCNACIDSKFKDLLTDILHALK